MYFAVGPALPESLPPPRPNIYAKFPFALRIIKRFKWHEKSAWAESDCNLSRGRHDVLWRTFVFLLLVNKRFALENGFARDPHRQYRTYQMWDDSSYRGTGTQASRFHVGLYLRSLSFDSKWNINENTFFFLLIPLTMMEISIKLTWWNVKANRVRQLRPRFVQIFINEFKCFQQIGKHSKNLKFSDTFVRARNWFQTLEGANRDDGEERKFLQFERAINTMWKLTNVVTVNQP